MAPDKWHDNDEGASSKIGVFLQIWLQIGVQPNMSEIALRHSADRGIKDRNGRPWSNRLYHTTVGQICWNRRIVFIFKSGQEPFLLYWIIDSTQNPKCKPICPSEQAQRNHKQYAGMTTKPETKTNALIWNTLKSKSNPISTICGYESWHINSPIREVLK